MCICFRVRWSTSCLPSLLQLHLGGRGREETSCTKPKNIALSVEAKTQKIKPYWMNKNTSKRVMQYTEPSERTERSYNFNLNHGWFSREKGTPQGQSNSSERLCWRWFWRRETFFKKTNHYADHPHLCGYVTRGLWSHTHSNVVDSERASYWAFSGSQLGTRWNSVVSSWASPWSTERRASERYLMSLISLLIKH